MRGSVSGIEWVVTTACVTWTLVMFIHIRKLNRAWKEDDDVLLQTLIRLTLRLVAIWQIILGISMGVIIVDHDGGGWVSTITLVGSGLAILALDWVRRKFEAVT